MKDQYFGDVNDFFKYGLLRSLTIPDRLSLGVCWMLTEPDGRTNDTLLTYLDQPNIYRHCDPGLFDWLRQTVVVEEDRRTARIAESTLLGSALFKPGYVTDKNPQRSEYFTECASRFAGCDLIFFDPDNGLEIKSTQRGRKGSCKYLYWNEVFATFDAGSSVLIYQHFPFVKRNAFIARMAAELQRRIGAATIFSYRTPHVLFLLASQERHAAGFRRQLAALPSFWAPEQVIGVEHAPPQEPGKGQPPVPGENRKPVQQNSSQSSQPERESFGRPTSSGETILIVEDDEAMRELIVSLVSQDHPDLHIESASDGLEALEKIAEKVPFILITNIVMAKMDGLELLRNLQRRGILLPTIVTSGYWQREAFEEWLAQQCIPNKEEQLLFLGKPFRLEQMQAWIEKVLKGKLGDIERN